ALVHSTGSRPGACSSPPHLRPPGATYGQPVLPLADRNPTSRTPVVTILLILVNIGVFVVWQGGGSFSADEDTKFTFEHAAIPCALVTGPPITDVEEHAGKCLDHPPRGAIEFFPDKNVYLAALVSMFLHGGWFHLLG